MEHLTIFYVANVRMPTGKAHGIQVANMCEAFATAGADTTLILPKRGEGGDITAAYGVRKNFAVVYLPVINLPLSVPGSFALQTLSFALAARWWLYKQKKKAIVYTRGEMSLFLAPWLSKRFSLVWEAHIKPENLKRYALTVQRSVAIVVVTKYFMEEIPKLWHVPKEKALYFPDGVSLADFSHTVSKQEARTQLSLPQDTNIVLYAGSDLVWKGVDILRGASNFLPDGYQAVFVGPIAPDTGKSPKRLFVGSRPHTEIPLWLAAADFLVLLGNPQSDIARYYTSPLKLFEYMASGTPILAANIPSFRDVLSERSAFIFEPTPQGCADMIAYAGEHREEAAARAAHAKQDVQEFSWYKRAEKIISFIQARI